MSGQRPAIFDVKHALGRVLFWPSDPVPAGSYGSWTTKLMLGGCEIRKGGAIAFAWRWAADWGRPQWERPKEANYAAVTTDGDAELECQFDRIEAWHPWDHVLRIAVKSGRLVGGQSVTLIYGDRTGGGPGARAQTFIDEAAGQCLRLDPTGGGDWTELCQLPVEIIGGSVCRLVAIAPSRVTDGEAFSLLIRAEDEWGNPASDYAGTVNVECGTRASTVRFDPNRRGIAEGVCELPCPGVYRIAVRDGERGLTATSNPVDCVAERPNCRVYWGDLHAQSRIGCGSRSIADYFAHARDVAKLDFASHQANDFLVSNAEWAETQAVTADFHEPGRFVSLLGIEWSGHTQVGGDRNLYFPHEQESIRRSSHSHVTDLSDIESDLPKVADVHRHYHNADMLMVPHVGGRTADLSWHDPVLERLVEIHSTHATSEWFFADAIARGMRVGVTAGSDGVDGRPGTSHPGSMSVRNLRGGLVAVEMPALTRDDLWHALRHRRCYATTGERILLELDANGHRMGEEFDHVGAPCLRVAVHGTTSLEAVEIHRGAERIFSAPLIDALPARDDLVRIAWRGAARPGNWQRARQVWDGEVRITGGSIRSAVGYAFDSPAEGLESVAPDRVTWRSITAGDWDGVIFELDAPPSARLSFRAAPLQFDLVLSELAREPRCIPAQGFAASVEIRRLPCDLPLSWAGVVLDEGVTAGTHAYWVHVRQSDGSQAWSSPVFITCRGPR